MASYVYTRDGIVGGAYNNEWDIPHPERLSTEDRSKQLENEITADAAITTALSSGCSMACDGDTCTIYFEDTLSGTEKTALDAVVTAHKNNT
jgi:hypothetical protein